MADPVVTPLINVGLSLTSILLNATQQQQAAAIVTDARDPITFLTQSLLGRRGTKKDIERRISNDLTSRMHDMNERCHRDGINSDRLASPCAEVEDILNAIDDHEQLLVQAVHDPDAVRAFFEQQAQNSRIQVDERLVPYFDELIKAVTELYITYAERSANYQQLALKQLLKSDREHRETWARMHETIADVPHKVAELVSSESKPSRIFFSSRPDVVAGERFIKRDEQKHLNELIVDATIQRTVLVGMRGCGKTQLAASLAQQCEDANWNLVAWINAVSRDSIQSDLVELAKKLKIDTSDQPTPETIIRRCFDQLKSEDPSNRLIVLDNVENIDDLRGLVPRGNGLRVVATTTNNTGWEHQGWDTIKVRVFDRDKSIDYLLTATESTDRDAADTLAHRLGDLPLALAQAAATALNEDWTLTQYLRCLEKHRSEQVIRSIPGDEYPHDVYGALRMAIRGALSNLDEGTRRAARRQLGALALLAESGVPTHWLDPMSKEPNEAEFQDHDRAADEDAHKALTKLIRRSIVQQSADRATTMLHRLQAQVLRESWTENEAAEAYESAAILLDNVDVDRFPRNDTDSRRQETLDLIEQLRAIGEQKYSRNIFTHENIPVSLFQALSNAHDLALFSEALTLEASINTIQEILGPEHPYTLAASNNLAHAYEAAGYLHDAIRMYEQVLADHTRIFGASHLRTFTIANNLAGAYESGGYFNKAINLYRQVLANRIYALGPDHPDVLTTQNDLAYACLSAGQHSEAIAGFDLVFKKRLSLLGPDDLNTLLSQNNLASAYASAGYSITAIALFLQTFVKFRRVLGPDHHYTLAARRNIAELYASAGLLNAAVPLYEDLLSDYQRILGTEHPLTKTVRENLEAARRELAQQEDDSAAE
jgi:hypothetical protein avisC_02045